MARILIIEDNAVNMELMRYLLAAFGHVITQATDGVQGLEAATNDQPDLVVCDIQLPKLDGYEIARRLKSDQRLGSMPLIAVTALAMVGDRKKGLAAGFDGYIHKPIDPEKFVAEVETFLPDRLRGSVPNPIEANPTDVAAERTQTRRGTVLVVDDTPTNLQVVQETLIHFGYEVWLAGGLEEAMSILGTGLPDLVMSDLHMPQGTGLDLLKRLKSEPRFAGLPIILVSSSIVGTEERSAALKLEVDGFLLRPTEPNVLVETIEYCLGRDREVPIGHDPRR